MATVKMSIIINAGEGVEESGNPPPPPLDNGWWECMRRYGKQHGGSSKKPKIRLAIRSSDPTPGKLGQTVVLTDACTPSTALSTIARSVHVGAGSRGASDG